MKVSTFTVVVGNKACNACCPFCVSKMTPSCGVSLEKTEINKRNFFIAAQFAKDVSATTTLLTGKGEPTLYPEDLLWFTKSLKNCNFHMIELQTNGKVFDSDNGLELAKDLYRDGMTTISLSIVHHNWEINQKIISIL